MSIIDQHHSKAFDAGYDTNTFQYLSWRRLHLSKSKLSGVAEMASFMAGFAVVATVELQINDEGNNPVLLTVFVVTTAVLVATSMLVILISTCILPQLDAVTKIAKCPSEEVTRSPHDALVYFVDLSWILANTVSLFLFTLDCILVCWIKWTYITYLAPVAATAILGPVLILISVFGFVFYRKIIKHQHDIFSKKYLELEELQRELQQEIEGVSLSLDGMHDLTLETESDYFDHEFHHPSTTVSRSGQLSEVDAGVSESEERYGSSAITNNYSVVYNV